MCIDVLLFLRNKGAIIIITLFRYERKQRRHKMVFCYLMHDFVTFIFHFNCVCGSLPILCQLLEQLLLSWCTCMYCSLSYLRMAKMTDWMTDWLTDRMNEWMNEWTNERTNERMDENTLTCSSGADSDGNQFELWRLRADDEVVALGIAFSTAKVSHFNAQLVALLVRQQMKVLVA